MRASKIIAALTLFLFLLVANNACSGASENRREPGATHPSSAPSPTAIADLSASNRTQDMTATPENPAMASKQSKPRYDVTPLSREKVAALAEKLSPEARRVTQRAGTEPAFCGDLVDNHKEGTYVCVVCGLPLFSSNSKFNSGSGWPSFFQRRSACRSRLARWKLRLL